jgi:hypothetical protein
MKMQKLLSYHAILKEAISVGEGPFGNRLIVEVDGGEFEGPRLKGTLRKAAAADWLTMCDDFGHLDVRATFETHDGAYIYVEYTGKLEMTPGVQAALAGEGSTEIGDQYFFTQVKMQTGDPRYKWVNNIVCVGQGRVLAGRVEYDVYQAMND